MTTIKGSCHCGNLSFVFQTPDPQEDIVLRACQCTFCTRHGGAWTSHANGRVDIRVKDENMLSRYRFGTTTADFLTCANCGCVVSAISEIEGKIYAVVNGRCFEDFDFSTADSTKHDFDGEACDERLDRRSKRWIPNVTLTTD